MLNQWVKQNNHIPIVFGGNNSSSLRSWMREIGVMEFVHAKLQHESIAPYEMQLSAACILHEYAGHPWIFSVGKFADRVLNMAAIDHGALPSKPTPLELNKAIMNCRNYLIRSGYAPKSSPNISS